MIPKQINIGGHNYKISTVERISAPNPDSDLGCINAAKQIIEIATNQEPTCGEQTLAHEILHALLKESGLESLLEGQYKVDVELIPTILENMFLRFLKDNTNFFGGKEGEGMPLCPTCTLILEKGAPCKNCTEKEHR